MTHNPIHNNSIRRSIFLLLLALIAPICALAADVSKTLPITGNYQPNGDAFAANDVAIDFSKQSVKAVIDLSTCSGSDENVLSIGNQIDTYGKNNSEIYNLHFYYTKSTGKLAAQLPSYGDNNWTGRTESDYHISGTSPVTIELTSAGLYINGIKDKYINAKVMDKLLALKTISVGSKEGKNRSHATYQEVSIVDNPTPAKAYTQMTLAGWQNFKPGDNEMFGTDNMNINFSKEYLEAEIDLSTCQALTYHENSKDGNKDELLFSIGNDIANFGTSGKYNLHFYYTPASSKLIVDYTTDAGSSKKEYSRDDIAKNSTLTIKLSEEGLYLNGTLATSNVTAENMSGLLALTTFSIGSRQTGGTGCNASHATYKSLKIVNKEEEQKTIIWQNEKFTNKFPTDNTGTDIAIDFQKEYVYAEIDLSTCVDNSDDGKDRSLLSIGNKIFPYSGTGQSTIHIYYKKNQQTLTIAYCHNSGNAKQQTEINNISSNATITLKLNKDGLYLDDNLVDKMTAENMKELLALTTISIGAKESEVAQATYKEVSIRPLPKTNDRELTLPWENFTPEKDQKFYTTNADIDFLTQGIEATIDVTNCTNPLENILSIGNKIADWGSINLHFYYLPENYKNYTSNGKTYTGRLTIDWLVNSDNPVVENRNINFEGNELRIKLNAQGLYINETKIAQLDANTLFPLLALRQVSIGSSQGTTRSNATYKNVAITTNGTASEGFSPLWTANEAKYEDHKEAAHATFIPYPNATALKADKAFYDEPWRQPNEQYALVKSLNSTEEGNEWRFCYVKGSTTAPGVSEYQAKDFDDSDWKTIRVPLSWEMAGYGNPVYTNIGYPFDPTTPPLAVKSHNGNNDNGDNNATGFYRRSFTLPEAWQDKRVFLHFDGVYSAAVVWVDGEYVGYSQGSNTDAEFDITEALTKSAEGNVLTGEDNKHQLSVRVYRWSDGSYLEGQDMWHLSGIHRDVYLMATPKVFVSDHVITASNLATDATSADALDIALTIDNRTDSKAAKTIAATLLDTAGNTIATAQGSYGGSAENGKTTSELKLSLNLKGKSLNAWSAEHPYLYTLLVAQQDDNGKEEMAFATKHGFRQLTQSGMKLLVNGQRVFFKGVNTQDAHPEYGRAIDMKTMLADLKMMKRANINTLRTSHYPRQPKMYAMMDALGFYVMDEADVECHYNWINQKELHLSDNEAWAPQYVDRNVRMVSRDRNHASVIFWSLGNESGDGKCFAAAYKAVKALDPSRLIHYEGSFNKGYSGGANVRTYVNSDLGSDMYPTVSTVEGYKNGFKTGSMAQAKPYFICEYAHAMGQAVGNLQEYWNVIEQSEGISGGCIWDWVDQAIYNVSKVTGGEALTDDNGMHYWTAGYDYNTPGGSYHQGNFLDNGLVTPDRRWTAKLTEVKKVYQYVGFEAFDPATKKLTVKNKYAFTNLSDYGLRYQVLRNGRIAEEGETAMPAVAPGAEATITLPIKTATTSNEEYLVNVALCTKQTEAWAEKDYPIADAQFSLTGSNGSIGQPTLSSMGSVKGKLNDPIAENGNHTISGSTATGKDFSITFDQSGKMTKWSYGYDDDGNNLNLLHTATGAGPDFNSCRNIDNDKEQNGTGNVAMAKASTTTTISAAPTKGEDGNITMSVDGTATNCNFRIDYTIRPDASVDMMVTFSPTGATRRLGLAMQLAEGFENVEFYARGPWSNYADRKTGSYLGRYYTTIADMTEEMIHPQTYGDHQDLRELTLTNPATGLSLNVKVEGQASFSLSHYDESAWCDEGINMWRKATHWYGLTPQKQVFAHFDYCQRGLGNNSCSGDVCLPKYLCPENGTYSYTLRFMPSEAE